MDLDIVGLEAVFSPYIALVDARGVSALSEALLGRLGLENGEARRAIGDVFSSKAPACAFPASIRLKASTGEEVLFSCRAVETDCGLIVALEESYAVPRPQVELNDRDTFVRMFMNTPAAGLIVDRGIVSYVNEHFAATMQARRESLIGNPLVDLVSRPSLKDLAGACGRWCSSEGMPPEPVELMFVTPSGRRVHWSARGGCVERRGRKLVWMVMSDLTE